MKTIIVTIGDEVTSGHIANGNAAWIARRLETVGLTPDRVLTLRDDEPTLVREIRAALKGYGLVILTGGLGPTHDDVTKPALCKALGVPLVRDRAALVAVKRHFKKLGVDMPENNLAQADIPQGAVALHNRVGTAPGIFVEREGALLFALPGVPAEMQSLTDHEVLPLLEERLPDVSLERALLHTVDIAESRLAELLEEEGLLPPPGGIEVAFLPHIGEVAIRLTAKGADRGETRERLLDYRRRLKKVIAPWYFGKEGDTLEQFIARRFKSHGLTLASAESCTGGLFAATLVAQPGASDYFLEGVVTYSDESKMKRLGVREKTLAQHGAVSAEVAAEMAKGVRKTAGADVGISATGIAGPTGGTDEKPVGLVWLGLAVGDEVKTLEIRYGFDRITNQRRTVRRMLVWLRSELRDHFAG
ncbi:MAG: CinA family nicotinamide mononucleotide deamidase-related protein [Nitrospinae bacterium]|nr:CinA family nicotinamide mononucleotide deamidase-related protein [Nitrospinota bacterium]